MLDVLRLCSSRTPMALDRMVVRKGAKSYRFNSVLVDFRKPVSGACIVTATTFARCEPAPEGSNRIAPTFKNRSSPEGETAFESGALAVAGEFRRPLFKLERLRCVMASQDRGLTRDFRIGDRAKIDTKARTVELAFSSTEPVERWGEMEVLSHDRGHYDFSRLNNAHPLLAGHNEHDPDSQIGVVEKAWVEDGKGRAKVRFGNSPRAKEYFQDVQDGIRQLVSVGYDRTGIVDSKTDAGVKTTRYRWLPTHIAIVPVPADVRCGVGRETPRITESRSMNTTTEDPNKMDAISEIRERTGALKRDHKHVAEALDLLHARAIAQGMSLADWTKQAWDIVEKTMKPANPIHLVDCTDAAGARRYSILRGIQACINGRREIPDGLEGEVHQEFVRKANAAGGMGFTPQGWIVPDDAPLRLGRAALSTGRQQRDMQVGVFGQGGAMVPTNLIVPVIEILRNLTVLDKVGARTMAGLQGNIVIPRETAAATAYSVAEIAALTDTVQVLDQVALTPKRVGATETYSKQLLIQSSPDVEAFVRDDLLKVIGIKWDYLGLNGAGANSEPLGILQTPGINSVTFGATPTYAKIVSMETAIRKANARGPLAYISTSATRGSLKITPATLTGSTVVSGASNALWTGPEEDGRMNDAMALATQQVPNDQVLAGVFDHLIHAVWGGLDVVVDIFTKAKNAEVVLTINTWGDYALRHPQAFCISTDSGAQ